MEGLEGPSSGTTWNAKRDPSSETATGATATTPLWSINVVTMPAWVEVWSSSATADGNSATTSSAPLTPAPNFSVMIVLARYWVVSVASEEPSGRPSRIESAGIAMTSSATIAMAACPTARQVRIGAGVVAAWSGWPMRARARRPSTRSFIRPSRAGVRVTATRTATATHTAPTVPITPRNGMPVTLSASSATITVVPANTTALPEVPFASPIDSDSSTPASSCRRCRLRMNSA